MVISTADLLISNWHHELLRTAGNRWTIFKLQSSSALLLYESLNAIRAQTDRNNNESVLFDWSDPVGSDLAVLFRRRPQAKDRPDRVRPIKKSRPSMLTACP